MSKPAADTTHFGSETVVTREKAGRVRGVFDSVAANYDLMNDLMSGGLHRIWKRFTLARTGLRLGDRALDVACGTGDLTVGLCRQVGADGFVWMTDINAVMLAHGRRRLVNAGLVGSVRALQADAERLPFADHQFNCVTIGFGLRNVTDKAAALASMGRVLKPGGRLLVLEFSKPALKFAKPLYEFHLSRVLPMLGRIVARDADSYRYLAESIRMHPDQKALLQMMTDAGLEDSHYYNLSGGVAALHVGYRY